MTVSNDVVYYASMDAKGTLFYLEAATGRLLGSFKTSATLGCGPSLARGKVFVGASLSLLTGLLVFWVVAVNATLVVRFMLVVPESRCYWAAAGQR
jgi:outer membrane protein assembly factor BamB